MKDLTFRDDQADQPAIELMERFVAMRAIPQLDYEGVSQRLSERIAEINSSANSKKALWRWAGYVTAAVVIATLIGSQVISKFTGRDNTSKFSEYRTKARQIAELKLADGSAITLAPGSTIRYSSDFGKKERSIYLNGQALFTVGHRSGSPFLVHTRNTVTQVLGTTFAVRAYEEDVSVRVVVAEGKVAVNKNTVLGIGEAATIGKEGKAVLDGSVNIAAQLGWTQSRLAFDREPFQNAIAMLERWYGVQIRVADAALRDVPLTATFRNQSVNNLVGVLSTVMEARAEIHGNVITLHKR